MQEAGSTGWCWGGGGTELDMQSAKLLTLSRNKFKNKGGSDWVNGFLAVGKFERRKMLKEGTSVSRGRQRMMVSIYISVWLRTWA